MRCTRSDELAELEALHHGSDDGCCCVALVVAMIAGAVVIVLGVVEAWRLIW